MGLIPLYLYMMMEILNLMWIIMTKPLNLVIYSIVMTMKLLKNIIWPSKMDMFQKGLIGLD